MLASPAFRYRLIIILMRVLGIQARDEAALLIKKIRTFHSDQRALDELAALFPEKRLADQDRKIQSDKGMVRDVLLSWRFHVNVSATRYLDLGKASSFPLFCSILFVASPIEFLLIPIPSFLSRDAVSQC